MTLTERTGALPNDWAGRWWDEMELPHIVTTRWIHFLATSTYSTSTYAAGVVELQILQGNLNMSGCVVMNVGL